MTASVITIVILAAIFIFFIQGRRKSAAESNDGEVQKKQSVPILIKKYKGEDPELAHSFSVRAARIWGISGIIHGLFILAFLFAPIEFKGAESLMECLINFISDPSDVIEFDSPVLLGQTIIAVSVAVWGLFHIFTSFGIISKSHNPDYTFSLYDYAAFFESCHETLISRFYGIFIIPAFSIAFWYFCLFMLEIEFEDVMISFIALGVYLIIYSLIEQEVRRSVYKRKEEYQIVECSPDDEEELDTRTSRPVSRIILTILLALLIGAVVTIKLTNVFM